MDTQIIAIQNVHGYVDEQGTVWLNTEDVARGLGFNFIAKSGNEVVHWHTVYDYLLSFGAATICHGLNYRSKCPEFISENMFYRLAMKANNETAKKFQIKITDEILPQIRKSGSYSIIN